MSNVKETPFIVRACGLLRHLYLPTSAWLIRNELSEDDIRGLWFYCYSYSPRIYIVYADSDNQLETYSLPEAYSYDKSKVSALVRYAKRLRRYAYAKLCNNEAVN